MSKIEAAASLFGSSDSGSDFFTAPEYESSPSSSAADGSDSAKKEELFSVPFEDGQHTHEHPNAEANSLFSDVEGDSHDIFNVGDHGVDANITDYSHAYSQEYDTGVEVAPVEYVASESSGTEKAGWYDEYGQWQTYGTYGGAEGMKIYIYDLTLVTYFNLASQYYQQEDPALADQSTNYAYANYPSTSAYYASTGPTTAHANTSEFSYDGMPTVTNHHHTYASLPSTVAYDPYSQQSNHSTYSSTVATSAYDPYKPQGVMTQPPVVNTAAPANIAASYPSSSRKIEEPPTSILKPPPAPYRPASMDAYDPPIPSTKSTKRSVSAYQPLPHSSTWNESLSSPPPLPTVLPHNAQVRAAPTPPPPRNARMSPSKVNPQPHYSSTP